MSDLISRSELLRRFSVSKDGYRIPERNCDNFEVAVSIKDVKTIIKEQPTAYDIDKAVEALEKAKHEITSEDYCRSINGIEKCDGRNCFECCAEYLIEIVKHGIVADGMCEWRQEDDNLITDCGDYFNLYDNCTEKFKYCPKCGRKIKEVEV